MTTIELKTIRTADEPDRSKKFTSGTLRASMRSDWDDKYEPLQYSEALGGWTWGAAVAGFDWEQIVQRHEDWFPLTETEDEVTLKDGTYKFADVGEDRLEMVISGELVRLYTQGGDGSGFRSVHFQKKDIAALKKFFDEHVQVTDATP